MSDPLRSVLVRRPDASFAVSDPKRWGYAAKPNLAAAQKEHDGLVELLKHSGIEILHHAEPQPGKAIRSSCTIPRSSRTAARSSSGWEKTSGVGKRRPWHGPSGRLASRSSRLCTAVQLRKAEISSG